MQILNLNPLSNEMLEELGMLWHTDAIDGKSYISDECIVVSEAKAKAFISATNELYDMYVEAGQYAIDNELFHDLDIPNSLVPMIKQSWEEEVNWHLYGRFDFAGGLDGQPLKLLEFNADTPTMVYESSVIAQALLTHNDMDNEISFNNLYDALCENFRRVVTLGGDPSLFDSAYEGWGMLFSSVRENSEDIVTTQFLRDIAIEAGWSTEYAYIDEVAFDESGVFYNDEQYEFLFKLIPWEDIAIDEGELALLMRSAMERKNTIFLNPAYTALFQSKMMLGLLWQLYPNHPLLLPASYTPLNSAHVAKPSFGREGENVTIYNADGSIKASKEGQYGMRKLVYQDYTALLRHGSASYQASVFYAYEACALGFRKGGEILDNSAKFVSHVIR